MAVKHITSPLEGDIIKDLRVGDEIFLSGRILTARDQMHKYLASGEDLPIDIRGCVVYHCGPVIVKEKGSWHIVAAGPTTSIREEPFEADIIERFQPGAIMGKGGMGESTLKAMKRHGCVYLNVVGGAALSLAGCIKRVEDVYMLEKFGVPEAMWVLSVENLPALVSMDAHDRSIHKEIKRLSSKRFHDLINL
ncbi:MAG: FumA C-terminus/TtdB family hydratase beta subunit [Thermodesulfobacteriota bacterium]|nr:FumA C-terminus/TtdB family hydratase beta subunit [Thermodesulfobacteriota bacterium]